MARYKVAVEHTNTHRIRLFTVEADTMSTAAGRGLQAADQDTHHGRYLLEVVSVWRLDIPSRKSKSQTPQKVR